MSQLPAQISTPPSNPADMVWWRVISQLWVKLGQLLNGNVGFGNITSGTDNLAGAWVAVTTPATPNTDFVVTHNLGYTASGYLVMSKSATCDVYTSPTINSNPTTQLILRATVASVSLTLFIPGQ